MELSALEWESSFGHMVHVSDTSLAHQLHVRHYQLIPDLYQFSDLYALGFDNIVRRPLVIFLCLYDKLDIRIIQLQLSQLSRGSIPSRRGIHENRANFSSAFVLQINQWLRYELIIIDPSTLTQGRRDIASALVCFFPGRCTILKWNSCSFSNHLANCPSGSLNDCSHDREPWPVLNVNSRPRRHGRNYCVNTTASNSR
jgi:hypothetical protein